MTEDIKKLKAAFTNEPPISPRKAAKKLAIEQAMAAFDEKNLHSSQGTRLRTRLMDTASSVYETLTRRRSMRMTPAFAGGASLSVMLVAALSATYIQTRDWNDPIGAKQPSVPKISKDTLADLLAREEKSSREKEQFKLALKKRKSKSERDSVAPRPAPPAPMVSMESRPHISAPTAGSPLAFGAPATGSASVQRRITAAPQQFRLRRITKPDLPAPGYYEDQGRDRFENVDPNPVKVVSENPVSTFSIDVDTASYSFMRSSLNSNVLPQKAAVRVEELINYFPYDYARPDDKSAPFKASVSVFPSPWNTDRKLMHIGIAGFDLKAAEKPHSNLVFLLDTSGSMNAPNKLPLVVNSMKLLLETLHPDDTVAIVTYAGNAGTALEPTQVKDKAKILQALNRLNSRGSTAGAEGIRQAYELAQQSFKKKGVNRVILATDGDFNVGITDRNELKSYIERKRKTGIFLSVLGFGRGNYNDALMQTLAQNGNGNAAYIDTLSEARKVLVEEASSTLFPIAKDVKLQVEFNPLKVAEYRLIGYETRMLKRQDFNNDKVDAGDIGAGHRVTALYEITPVGSKSPSVDMLRYGSSTKKPAAGKTDEYGFLKIRYKLPKEDTSKLITTPVGSGSDFASIKAAPNEARFATAVAAFGQILKGGQHTGAYSYDDVIALAQSAKGKDEFGYRSQFINLVRLAKSAPALGTLKPR
jgi:Ca-activated chloride channel family protein